MTQPGLPSLMRYDAMQSLPLLLFETRATGYHWLR
jgi:hypothetical protein